MDNVPDVPVAVVGDEDNGNRRTVPAFIPSGAVTLKASKVTSNIVLTLHANSAVGVGRRAINNVKVLPLEVLTLGGIKARHVLLMERKPRQRVLRVINLALRDRGVVIAGKVPRPVVMQPTALRTHKQVIEPVTASRGANKQRRAHPVRQRRS